MNKSLYIILFSLFLFGCSNRHTYYIDEVLIDNFLDFSEDNYLITWGSKPVVLRYDMKPVNGLVYDTIGKCGEFEEGFPKGKFRLPAGWNFQIHGNYTNGVKNGDFWAANEGFKNIEADYKNNKLNGWYVIREKLNNGNAQLKLEGELLNNQQIKIWNRWDSEGDLVQTYKFNRGEVYYKSCFDSFGGNRECTKEDDDSIIIVNRK